MKPFMDPKEAAFVVRHLRKDMSMLEWGSGGSTSYFSKYVDSYYSVEHDQEWADKVSETLPENVTYFHIPSSEPYERPRDWRTNPSYDGTPTELFEEYINLHSLEDVGEKFDVVLVDGRCRVACAMKARDFLKPDGILFFHDFFPRKEYHKILEHYTLVGKVSTTTQTIAAMKPKENK